MDGQRSAAASGFGHAAIGIEQPAAYLRGAREQRSPQALAAYTVDHLCDVTDAEWGECVGAGTGSLTLLATTDADLTAELMRAREHTGEPPTPEAMVDELVVIEDLSRHSPWPQFAAEATRTTGVRSAVLPYFTTPAAAGVLTVIDSRPQHFGPAQQRYARLVADLFALLLTGLESSASHRQLEQAVVSGRVIGAAVGMLAERRGISTEEAFESLRSTSQHTNRKLRQLAEEVLQSPERFPG